MSQGLSTFISEKWTRRWIQRKQKCTLCQQHGHLACITDLFGFHTILMRPSDYHWLCHRHKSFLELTSHHLYVAMKAGHDRFLKPGLKPRCFNIIDFNSFRWLKYASSVRKRQGRCLGFWFMYATSFVLSFFLQGVLATHRRSRLRTPAAHQVLQYLRTGHRLTWCQMVVERDGCHDSPVSGSHFVGTECASESWVEPSKLLRIFCLPFYPPVERLQLFFVFPFCEQ